MSEAGLIFIIVIIAMLGAQIGFVLGMERTQRRLLPEIIEVREYISRARLLAKMNACPLCAEVTHG